MEDFFHCQSTGPALDTPMVVRSVLCKCRNCCSSCARVRVYKGYILGSLRRVSNHLLLSSISPCNVWLFSSEGLDCKEERLHTHNQIFNKTDEIMKYIDIKHFSMCKDPCVCACEVTLLTSIQNMACEPSWKWVHSYPWKLLKAKDALMKNCGCKRVTGRMAVLCYQLIWFLHTLLTLQMGTLLNFYTKRK